MKKETRSYTKLLKLYIKLIAELKRQKRQDLVKKKVTYAKRAIDEFSRL